MGDGTREEVEAYGPTEEQDQQQFEAEVQQWEREEREIKFIEKVQKSRGFDWEPAYNAWLDKYGHSDDDWWKTLDKEKQDAGDGHSGTETKETLPSK